MKTKKGGDALCNDERIRNPKNHLLRVAFMGRGNKQKSRSGGIKKRVVLPEGESWREADNPRRGKKRLDLPASDQKVKRPGGK